MLKIENITKSFDGIKAVRNVTVEFQSGKVYALIGPNGAGKTTLLNLINGFIRPDEGKIFVKGEDVTEEPPYKISRMGVGRLFQEIRIFPKTKVMDNLLIPKQFESEENPISVLMRVRINKGKREIYLKEAEEYLKEMGIEDKKDSYAEDLSYGQEKLLAFSRLLMGNYDILLLDEPIAGVNPNIKNIIYRKIKAAAAQGKLIIVVEHEMEAIRRVADYAFFMDDGEITKEGKPKEVLEDKNVVKEYIGFEPARSPKPIEKKKEEKVLLKAENIYAAYYKRDVLRDVNIEIREKEIVGLIGPNGAGKSTLLKILAGVLPAKKGKIYYSENGNFRDITHLSARERVNKGIGYFIQGGEVFFDLLVEENLDISAIDMHNSEREKQKTMLFEIFPVLWEKRKARAGLLSGGERQMLALVMVLMKKSKILLWLDEPSAGLAPKYTEVVLSKIREIRDRFSTSILLVEQRVGEVLANADRVYIMKTGEIIEENIPGRIKEEKVEEIFMGNHNERMGGDKKNNS